jgi:hypothetical protein
MQEWAVEHFVPHLADKPSFKKLVVEVLSIVLICLGVVGELVCGVRLTAINGRIRAVNGELRDDSTKSRDINERLVILLKEQSADIETSAKHARGFAREAQKTADAVGVTVKKDETVLVQIGKQERQVNVNLAEGELWNAAQWSGQTFRPLLFRALNDSAKVKVFHLSSATPATKWFAEKLLAALRAKGWDADSGMERLDVGQPGVTIFNKWATVDRCTEGMPTETLEWDPMFPATQLANFMPIDPPQPRFRLATLCLALRARLVKDDTLPDNSFQSRTKNRSQETTPEGLSPEKSKRHHYPPPRRRPRR